MVTMRVQALTEHGDEALWKVQKMSLYGMGTKRVVSENPLILEICVLKKMDFAIKRDPSLAQFVKERSLLTVQQSMEQSGAQSDDYTAEVVL